jgi:hypothetical protein
MPKSSGLPVIRFVLLAGSSAASAQDVSLTLPTIVFVVSAASDQATTVYGFHTPPLVRGPSTLTFVEADPLYAWTNRHSGSYVAVSTGVDPAPSLESLSLDASWLEVVIWHPIEDDCGQWRDQDI